MFDRILDSNIHSVYIYFRLKQYWLVPPSIVENNGIILGYTTLSQHVVLDGF